MKLKDIVLEDLTSIQRKTTNAEKGYKSSGYRAFDDGRSDSELMGDHDDHFVSKIQGTKTLGSGAFSTVLAKPKNDQWIGKARKWVHGSNDFANQEYATKYLEQGQGNPFVPVVYSIRKQTRDDKYGKVDQFIDMEQLTPVLKVVEQLTPSGDTAVNRFTKTMYDFSGLVQSIISDTLESPYHSAIADFTNMMRAVVGSGQSSVQIRGQQYSLKPEFIECCTLIKKLVDGKLGAYYDLHIENYMVRLTPHGPQLVITDPIAVE